VQSVAEVVPNDRGDNTPPAIILKGLQMVPKFNHTTPDSVRILMALFRVECKDIDLVVTFNIPLETVDSGAVNGLDVERAEVDFDTFFGSLEIVDFSLFA